MRAAAGFLIAWFGVSGVSAQAPIVEKVDPPSWFAPSTVNPVRILIRGKHLEGARAGCARAACTGLKINAAGTYAFLDVALPAGTAAGSIPITLSTSRGRVEVPFRVSRRVPGAGRGFGPDDVIYLIMPDRFANGDPGNDDPAVSRGMLDRANPRFYHGGDLAGVRQRLPYLKSLGVTAIWLNPIYDNTNTPNRRQSFQGQPITDYHGYGAVDFYGMEERFGDFTGLGDLIAEARRVGIKIILDMVANHTGPYHPWVNDAPTPTWFNGTAGSHLSNNWQIWTLADPYATPAVRERTLSGWFADVLPDLNQDDPEVARYIIQNSLWWIGVTGADGIRQDTWPYVPRRFWRDWMTALKREFPRLTVVGEVWDGNPALVSFFEGGKLQPDGIDDKVDYLFDFPLFYPMRRAFAEGRDVREVAQMLSHDRLYRNPSNLVTFLGLHDVQRFMAEPGATPTGLKLAFTFLLTTRGIPLIYYGDEIGMPGGNDPDNRRDFPGGWPGERNAFEAANRTRDEQEIFQHVQKLLGLRSIRPELRGRATQMLVADPQTLVYRRGPTVVAINNDTASVTLKVPGAVPGSDLLGICQAPRPASGVTEITVPARSGCVFGGR